MRQRSYQLATQQLLSMLDAIERRDKQAFIEAMRPMAPGIVAGPRPVKPAAAKITRRHNVN
jgi:hypothetical protein